MAERPAGAMDGKVAIVTGGAAGIGRAVAERLHALGARVVIADIAGAEDQAAAIDPSGTKVLGVHADVSSDADVEAMVAGAEHTFGGCHLLVNNAGIATSIPPRAFDEIDIEEWRKVFDVNVFGIFRCCRAVAPVMERSGGGRIVNIGSAAAFKGVPYLLHYVASKGAVLAMTRSLGRELGTRNILVNAVAPGFTISEAVRSNPGQMNRSREISLQGRTIQRDMFPDDVVGAVIFLAGPDSAFMTGQTLVVDGGTYLH